MPNLKTVLVVDDNAINRAILSKIIAREYTVLEAENGKAALAVLSEHSDEIAAVMLDLVMPVMDGYAVLEAIRKNGDYSNLPIVVTTGSVNHDNERRALSLGAWDFVAKPYDAQIILFRLKNAIDRSQLSALKQLKYLAEYDTLTGIYNKIKFFDATREMIDANREKRFAFLRFDVDRFQLINSFFGTAEGDKLLIYIAHQMAKEAQKYTTVTYGRIESDVVALCMLYDKSEVEALVRQSKDTLAQFNPNYDIVPSIGICVIDDSSISVEEMYNRASLAAKTCKGNYVDFYAYYSERMSASLASEQEITNEMNAALAGGQFQIYLQPQYNIHTNLPCGAEALVRWMHPKKGIVPPDAFIPVFERNGFITKLDFYVWEQACKCLHRWIMQGGRPYPLSVNVSRVNLYNPNLTEMLLELVNRYRLSPSLLHLELTESAYTDNPTAMKKMMEQLQSHGFVIMMDDFGSGYSSLSLLKDIVIDVLKIDMRFLAISEFPGRGENIIASVIRMAKWLKLPVIAEGAETEKQVNFLRSVGCDYVQGYYFARPMPVEQYEKLCSMLLPELTARGAEKLEGDRCGDLFSFDSKTKELFNNALQAAVIYEFADDRIEPIRVNEAYYELLGHDDMLTKTVDVLELVEPAYRALLLKMFRLCVKTQHMVECEYKRCRAFGKPVWIHTRLRYADMVGNKHILIGELTDITMRKALDSELKRYKESWLDRSHGTQTILIVDDAAVNRVILKKILQSQFLFLEAENGEEALKILRDRPNEVDLILLDITMPVMDGKEFLRHKKNRSELGGIPVIMTTADDSDEQQTDTFSLGANDYIVKPFVPAVVTRRVNNVLESNNRFKEMVREYNAMSEQVKTDLMTGLINRFSAEEMITHRLKSTKKTCAMVMLDIDNFKRINDTRGHDYGDKIICAVAEKLRCHFRKEDIIARMGGDEFAVLIGDVPDAATVEQKTQRLCGRMSDITIDGENAAITCSAGIAFSTRTEHSFAVLYQKSDKALYNAKCRGRNVVSVYGEESAASSVSKWINDAQSVLDAIHEKIYVCDKDTYELIYANDSLCKMMGVVRENCRGKKCYEVLMHRTSPCKFCSMPKMVEGEVYTRLFRMPSTAQIFLMHGENINRNGTNVHLEVAIDVTDVQTADLQWSEVTGYDNQ